MIRRPPRSTQGVSSAASDVYKRQGINAEYMGYKKKHQLQLTESENLYKSTIDAFNFPIYVLDSSYNILIANRAFRKAIVCLLYTSPSPRDLSTSRMPSSA
eukprot:TRINITY_DN61218_c0_g1_i1.p2 TRINITY_DN61218_c0_g1~~TRINITY_DN61218_c0_g1_i1.p2  ORF type:complete len:101 (+),score=30.12 TRINITY_DN61218_c0_g1_i1:117-419(+)